MTHIEQMIKDMCPHGVEFKTLGEVCTIETGKLNANAAEENGQYPFFTTSKEISYINEYKWDTEALLIAGNANIGDVKHYIGKFNAYQRTYVLTNFQDGLIVRFLYHYTKARLKDFLDDKKNEAAMSYIVLSSLQAFPIPLPPLEIQKKIVECLDKFSALAAELQAELQMRRKQYEYYRTQLLTPHSDCNSADKTDDCNWEWKTLGEIAEIDTGNKNRQDAVDDGEYPFYVRSKDVYRINSYSFDEEAIIIPGEGGIGDIFHYVNEKYDLHQRAYRVHFITSDINTKYAFYYLQVYFKDYIMNKAVAATVTSIRKPMLQGFPIAFPSLEEQARIVAILDKFEALTTSLSDGIPAEQAAQQKRYEYFRDLLLTFDRKAV